MAGSTRPSRLRGALAFLAFALLAVLPLAASAQTPAGTPIPNTGYANYDVGGVGVVRPSNTLVITTAVLGTSSNLEFMRYAPGAPGATTYAVTATECFDGSGFNPLPAPNAYGGGPIPLAAVELIATGSYRVGEPLFVVLADADQNLDPGVPDTVLVGLAVAAVGDVEQIRLYETGLSTGVFVGYIPSAAPPAPANDCVLAAPSGQLASGSYSDALDATDSASDTAIFDPEARVFDSATGDLVSGALITLIDDATGLPATGVLGDDGVSAFPATVTSGGSVTDGGGQTYNFGPGGYRFPIVPAGSYRLQVTPPADYAFPTTFTDLVLQTLPGAPFALATGSRGEVFAVAGPTFLLDLPLDSDPEAGFISIRASRDVISIGDHLQYAVRVVNPGSGPAPGGVDVSVVLPLGFRFVPKSVRIDDQPVPDPVLSPDGRTLSWTLPPSLLPVITNIRFTVKVMSGAQPGPNRASARAEALGGVATHTAFATVRVEEELHGANSFIVGRVAAGDCASEDFSGEALAGVRVYLEDGTYVVTDENGYYHFAGVRPGAHVVQMDVDSLPGFYEPLPCANDEGHAFAGRPFSQFVDLQGGTLWRSDFRVQLRPRRQGAVNQRLESQLVDGVIHYQLALRGTGVPLRNVRALVMLPEGARYAAGSARNAGVPIADPHVAGNVLTFRLGDMAEGEWSMDLQLDGLPPGGAGKRELESKSVVMFETPADAKAQTPPAVTRLAGESSSGSGMQVIETLGLRPGEAWPSTQSPAPKPEPVKFSVYGKTWLEQARPGTEWLSPEPGFAAAIASVHIAIKHAPGSRLELDLNGEPVSKFNFEGTFQNTARTVALSRWRGVDLVEGDNHFVLRELDPSGAVLATLERTLHYAGPPFRVELVPELSTLVADGKTTPVVAVRLLDKDDKPARQGAIGGFALDPPYRSSLAGQTQELRRQAGLAPEGLSYTVGEDGIARIELAPTTVSGRATLRFPLANQRVRVLHPWLEAEARDWVLVGLTNGTLAHAEVSEHMESLVPSGVEDGFDLERGTSLFAKGRVKGSWLLTAAYDSRRESNQSNELIERAALEGGFDPNQYYTLYGDSTTQGFEAPSQRKLYLKIERKQFYALFGDYQTGLTLTELSRYNRRLNGLHSEFENEHFTLNAFGTDTSQAFVRDEIRGDGTSGLYRLSRRSLVVNGEQVRIETRDRFHAERVLTSEGQTRYVDYNIDYVAGTIFFKRPIPSTAEGFNPVYIVVEYESDDDGDNEYSGGGRGSVKLFDERFELGTTLLHEGTVGRSASLYGSDVRVDLDGATQLRGEYAMSNASLLDDAIDPKGGAWLAELTRRDSALDSRLYWREQRAGFGLGQQSATQAGIRQVGADGRYELSDTLRISLDAFRQLDLDSTARRDVVEGRTDYHQGPISGYGGLRWAHDLFSDGLEQTTPQLLGGGSYTTYGSRLKLRADSEVALGGDDSLEFPTRFLVGADFELLPDLTVFGEEELTLASERSTTSTRVGLRTSPWQGGQMTAALGQRSQQDADRLFTTLGALQTFQLTDAWSIDAAVDNSITLSGEDVPATAISPFAATQPVSFGSAAVGDDYTALSLGTTYARDLWAVNLRVENRFGDESDKWSVQAGAYRELSDGVGIALRAELFDASGNAASLVTTPYSSTGPTYLPGSTSTLNSAFDGVESLARVRFSAVYRPVGSRFVFLDSTEFRSERFQDDLFESRSHRIINNMNLNVKLDRKTQLSLQYGAKYLLEKIDGQDLDGYTDLMGVELRRDLWGAWDIGARTQLRHSWSDGNVQELYSVSLGYVLMKNMWISAGYNWGGYHDRDFSRGDWTQRGPFLSFRYKFDQETVKELLDWAE